MNEQHTIPTWSLLHDWAGEEDFRRPILAIVAAPDPETAEHIAEEIYTITVDGQRRHALGDLTYCVAVFRGDISATLTPYADIDVVRLSTDQASQPAAGGCGCPLGCPFCRADIDTPHDLDCLWQPRYLTHQPRPDAPIVTGGHIHRPGCRQIEAHPGALFIPAEQCSFCGAFNTCERDSFPSFGGTTEGYERCTGCGRHWGWADLTAVL